MVLARAVLEDAAERAAAPEAVAPVLQRLVEERPDTLDRLVGGEELTSLGRALVAVAEASNVLARLCLADPEALEVLGHLEDPPAVSRQNPAALARSARLVELHVAARDLLGLDSLETVGRSLAALAAEVLDGAVAMSGAEVPDGEALAVIGMGKLGGTELNYASDVDVLFVSDGADSVARARHAMELARASFRVDADLRPEGRAGTLARTPESYAAYWQRWASAWEFQALLKARPVAGDAALGMAFAGLADRAVWERTFSADELAELRSMKARGEQLVARRRSMAGQELKRGPGGIRDVEFAVQLLQLVHGRLDPAIRARSTLSALAQLGAAGYVSEDDATTLADHYRFLRTVEHRLQLIEHEQTHALPRAAPARRRIARLLGFADTAGATGLDRFDDELRRRLAEVRAIHERLFFRPLLESFAGASMAMSPEVVAQRLAAFGFPDARRTALAVEELAGGLTRSSRLMAQMLPLLLDWLSLTPDPDLGLLGLRTLVVHSHHRALLVSTFRESPEAARRLCLLLGSSRALAEALGRNPDLLASLDDDGAVAPDPPAVVRAEAGRRLRRASDNDGRRLQLLRLRQDQFVRVATGDLLGIAGVEAVGRALAETAEALLQAAVDDLVGRLNTGVGFCVVGMGRLGGFELAYASDLDVVFVHGGEEDEAGLLIAEGLLQLVHGTNPAARLATLDLGLRPEGGQGRLSRSVAGYRLYFSRWAQTWERQALLRARPVAGDDDLAARFMDEVHQLVWHRPFGEEEVAELRRMKARIERERIPSGEDPQFHLKLGRGSLSDVEWTVQLLQLKEGVPGTSTMSALDALEAAGHVTGDDADALRQSYRFCEHTRNRWHLVGALAGGAGRGDALPSGGLDLSRLARSLGTTPAALRDEYRRVTRRARRVTERLFYGVDSR